VVELEEEIMVERNSFADQIIVLKRAKKELEARCGPGRGRAVSWRAGRACEGLDR
jgi:hypothetical protein